MRVRSECDSACYQVHLDTNIRCYYNKNPQIEHTTDVVVTQVVWKDTGHSTTMLGKQQDVDNYTSGHYQGTCGECAQQVKTTDVDTTNAAYTWAHIRMDCYHFENHI